MSSLLLGIVLSVRTCWCHNMLTLSSWLVSTDFGTWSYWCLFSNFIPTSLHMLKCSSAHILSRPFVYCSSANIGYADVMCSTVSSNYLHGLHLLSVSICNIFVALYLICNAWACAVIILLLLLLLLVGRDSVVGTETGYELGGPGIESRWGRDYPHPFRLALGYTQPSIHWGPVLLPGGKAAGEWRWPTTPI